MIYRSKKDAWVIAVIGLGLSSSLAVGLWLLLKGGEGGWVSVGVGVGAWALFFALAYPLYYEVTPTRLLVRSGRLRWDIPLEEIEEVSPSDSPLSSPALSLDRLRVTYRSRGASKSVLISPRDKYGFMRELASFDAGLQMTNNSLRRRRY